MAINSGRIAAGPTLTRAGARQSYARITSTIPPANSITLDPKTNSLEIINQLPEREGQILVYSTQNETALYVVVDIGGTLTWKRAAAISGVIDSTTGKPFGL